MRIQLIDSCTDVHESLLKYLADKHEVNVCAQEQFIDALTMFRPHVVLFGDPADEPERYFQWQRQLHLILRESDVRTVVFSKDASRSNRVECHRMGFDEFIELPIDFEEFGLRLANIERVARRLEHYSDTQFNQRIFLRQIENVVQRKSGEIRKLRNLTVFVIAKLAESRSTGMGGHLERIREYCDILCRDLLALRVFPELDEQFIEDMYSASPLHDIGKIIIPDAILNKQGSLTRDEFGVIQRHSAVGAKALRLALDSGGECSFLNMAVNIAQSHHERFDGTGYPDGLSRDNIPLAAQIVSVADVFDAMTTSRVYKNAVDPRDVRDQIIEAAGVHFNPKIVEAFERKFDTFLEIHAFNSDAKPEMLVLQDSFQVFHSK